MQFLETLEIQSWHDILPEELKNRAIEALENGKVVFFPSLSFQLHQNENEFLNPEKVDPKRKNISYDICKDSLGGTLCKGEEAEHLKKMVKRYAVTSRNFLEQLIPYYTAKIVQAKTSFRPVEIAGRKNPSYRKDDKLLHVDAFPSNPTKGKRILRFFTNVNPERPRVWRVGEPFEEVVRKIAPKISHPVSGVAYLLKLLRVTKNYRTAYDHYMLQIHDRMKGDKEYQQNAPQNEILFPAGSSWMVYTDQVSHAALSGQHVFEQTFHLPWDGVQNISTSPLKVLEKFYGKSLI